MKTNSDDIKKRAKNFLSRRHLASTHKKSRVRFKLRVLIWVVEAVVFLAVMEHFVIAPALKYEPSSGKDYTKELPPPFKGEMEKNTSSTAEKLKGLNRVSPVGIPNLEFAAEGSTEALDKQREYSRKTNLPIEVVNTMGMRFRLIPPGTYTMGSPPDEEGRNKTEPPHEVRIPHPFYMSIHEVTQGQWDTLMDSDPSYFEGKQRPVEEITWYDCLRFLEKLCKHENVEWGNYRLPTEQEWEYSCRAGTSTAFVCGNTAEKLNLYAVYKKVTVYGTEPVGKRLPNAWGLFNMHGNVWEWCLTQYYKYDSSPVPDEWRGARAIRGGNWQTKAVECRSANRARLGPTSHGNVLGFRIVREIPQELYKETAPPPPREVNTPPPPAELLNRTPEVEQKSESVRAEEKGAQ